MERQDGEVEVLWFGAEGQCQSNVRTLTLPTEARGPRMVVGGRWARGDLTEGGLFLCPLDGTLRCHRALLQSGRSWEGELIGGVVHRAGRLAAR